MTESGIAILWRGRRLAVAAGCELNTDNYITNTSFITKRFSLRIRISCAVVTLTKNSSRILYFISIKSWLWMHTHTHSPAFGWIQNKEITVLIHATPVFEHHECQRWLVTTKSINGIINYFVSRTTRQDSGFLCTRIILRTDDIIKNN